MVGKRLLCVVTLLNKLQNIVLQNSKVFSSQNVFFVKITKCIYVNQKYILTNAKYLELLRVDKPLLVGWPAGRVITDLMLRARLI